VVPHGCCGCDKNAISPVGSLFRWGIAAALGRRHQRDFAVVLLLIAFWMLIVIAILPH
jgi:hypothetical protein